MHASSGQIQPVQTSLKKFYEISEQVSVTGYNSDIL